MPIGEVIEQSIRLNFFASNNEAIIVELNLAISVSLEKICIRSDSQLVVGQLNEEYEARDQCMAKYVSLINLRLGCFAAWRLEHIPRISNRKADAMAVVVASLPIKDTVLFLVYYQPKSSITTNQVNKVDEVAPSWMALIVSYLSSREQLDDKAETHKIQVQAT